MVYRLAIFGIEPRLHLVHSEKRIGCAGLCCLEIGADHGFDGFRLQQRVCRMGHQVMLRGNCRDVVSEYEIH